MGLNIEECEVGLIHAKENRLRSKLRYWGSCIAYIFGSIGSGILNFVVANSTCALTVIAISIFIYVMNQVPLMMLMSTYESTIEADILIKAGNLLKFPKMNYTLSLETLKDSSTGFSTIRSNSFAEWISSKTLKDDCSIELIKSSCSTCDSRKKCKKCIIQLCSDNEDAVMSDLFLSTALDLKKEESIGMNGRSQYSKLGPYEVYVSSVFAFRMNVSKGDGLWVVTNSSEIYGRGVLEGYTMNSNVSEMSMFQVVVKDVVDVNFEKFLADTFVLTDIVNWPFSVYSSCNLARENPDFVEKIKNINSKDYAGTMIFNFEPPRIKKYLDGTFKDVAARYNAIMDKLVLKLGFIQISVFNPLLDKLRDSDTQMALLRLVLLMFIGIFSFFSFVLIFSILDHNIKIQKREIAILRVLGLTAGGTIALVLCKLISYNIANFFLGTPISLLIMGLVSYYLDQAVGVETTKFSLIVGFALISFLITIVICLASSAPHIYRLMYQTLNSSLNEIRKVNAEKVSQERCSQKRISVSTLSIGVLCTVLGVLSLYLIPLGLMTMDIYLLMNVFFVAILGVMYAFVMIFVNLLLAFQKAMLALFFWESSSLKRIVLMNLLSHNSQNTKIALVLLSSSAFIVYMNITFNTLGTAKDREFYSKYGTDIAVDCSLVNPRGISQDMVQVLKKNFSNYVEDVAFYTKDAYECDKNLKSIKLGNIGGLVYKKAVIYAISANFYKVVKPETFTINEVYGSNSDSSSLSEELYKHENMAIFATLHKRDLGAQAGQNMDLSLKAKNEVWEKTLGTFALLDSSPSFDFTKYPSLKSEDVLISLPKFYDLFGSNYKSQSELPIKRLLIKTRGNITGDKLEKFCMELETYLKHANQTYAKVHNSYYNKDDSQNLFFIMLSVLVVLVFLVSAFSLFFGTLINVNEERAKIGLFMAIGMPKSWFYKIYMYETFLLVFSSLLLGIVVGEVLSYFINMQLTIFLLEGLPFYVPWIFLIVIVFMSILLSVIPIIMVMQKLFKSTIANNMN